VAVEVTAAGHPLGARPRRAVRAFSANRWALLALPPALFLCVAFAYPLYVIVEKSFTEPTTGFGNYTKFFETGVYVDVLVRTLTTSVMVTGVCLVLGYPYAYLMTQVGPTWRRLLIFFVLVPLWTSLLVRTFAWTVILQDTGVINQILLDLGIVSEPVHLIRTTTGVVIGTSQVLLPFFVLPLYANLRTIDPSLMRAASNLGARPLNAFWRVYLPLSLPGVTAGGLIVFIYALGFYVTPALLGSPGNALLSQLIVNQISQLLDFGFGSAMAGILLAVTLILVGLLSRIIRTDTGYDYR
jgi:putative spermidine/putrescine transport system permease protein